MKLSAVFFTTCLITMLSLMISFTAGTPSPQEWSQNQNRQVPENYHHSKNSWGRPVENGDKFPHRDVTQAENNNLEDLKNLILSDRGFLDSLLTSLPIVGPLLKPLLG